MNGGNGFNFHRRGSYRPHPHPLPLRGGETPHRLLIPSFKGGAKCWASIFFIATALLIYPQLPPARAPRPSRGGVGGGVCNFFIPSAHLIYPQLPPARAPRPSRGGVGGGVCNFFIATALLINTQLPPVRAPRPSRGGVGGGVCNFFILTALLIYPQLPPARSPRPSRGGVGGGVCNFNSTAVHRRNISVSQPTFYPPRHTNNLLHHTQWITPHHLIRESNHHYPLLTKETSALLVILKLEVVRTAIHLDTQFQLRTIKIEDIAPNSLLSSEFKPTCTTPSQNFPDNGLLWGGMVSELFAQRCLVRVVGFGRMVVHSDMVFFC